MLKTLGAGTRTLRRGREKHSCREEKHGRRRGDLSSMNYQIHLGLPQPKKSMSERGVYAWQIAPIFKWGGGRGNFEMHPSCSHLNLLLKFYPSARAGGHYILTVI